MVDRIKALCRAQNTSVTKLELSLGFGNGTIGKWRNSKNAPSADKLQKVADALGVDLEYLLTGDNEKKPSLPEEKELSAVQLEAIAMLESMSDEELARFIAVAKLIKGENKS
jgi:transcriptional regulator with XRE-family HTH domain